MFAHAIYATDEGSCRHDDPRCLHGAWRPDVTRHDFKEYLRAMTGRGGPAGGGHRHGHHRGPRGFGRGRKARRGDIRTAALLLLAEEPRNGYQIMQEVEERSDGVWRPSPGSV